MYSKQMHPRGEALLLRMIAVLKFCKAVLLVVAGIGILRVLNKNLSDYVQRLVFRFHVDPGNRFVEETLARAANITPHQLHEVGVVSFFYAVLFLVEGIGLWTLKRWGEWVTVIITGSLLPLEMYELWRRTTLVRATLLLVNAGIVWYLARRIIKR